MNYIESIVAFGFKFNSQSILFERSQQFKVDFS